MNKVYNSRLILIATTLVILNAAFGIAAHKVETTPPTREQAVTSPAAAFEYFKLCDEASTQKIRATIEKNPGYRQSLLTGQSPYVAIVGCSDSRVPYSEVMGSKSNDIFTVSLAGNVVSDDAIASIEFAVKYLKVPLVVVLGHDHCGAVSACMNEAEVGGALPQLIGKIRPAVQSATKACVGCDKEALFAACIEANAKLGMEELTNRSPIIRSFAKEGKIALACGVIDLTDGFIRWVVTPTFVTPAAK